MPGTGNRIEGFTDQAIRRMTRVANKYGAVNLSQGFPDFYPPEAILRAALAKKQSRLMGIPIEPDCIGRPWRSSSPRDGLPARLPQCSTLPGAKTRNEELKNSLPPVEKTRAGNMSAVGARSPFPASVPQSQVQIGPKIFDVLDADRQAQQPVVDAQAIPVGFRYGRVGLRHRIGGEGFDTTQAFREHDEAHPLEDTRPGALYLRVKEIIEPKPEAG